MHARGALLDPSGLVAIAERAEPMRFPPDKLELGRPGLAARLADAREQWFARMREGLTNSVPSRDVQSMMTTAGLEVIGTRLARVRVDAPLPDDARRTRSDTSSARGNSSRNTSTTTTSTHSMC